MRKIRDNETNKYEPTILNDGWTKNSLIKNFGENKLGEKSQKETEK